MNWLKRQFEKFNAQGCLQNAHAALIAEQYEVAIEQASSALHFYESISDEAATIQSLIALATGYFGAQKYVQAEEVFRKSLDLLDSLPAKNSLYPLSYDLALIASLTGLGELNRKSGKHEIAETQLQQALKLIDKVTIADERVPEFAQTLNGLGCIHVQNGKHSEAEKLFKRAFKMIEFPPQGWANLNTLSQAVIANYANLLRSIGKLEQAAELEQHAAAIRSGRK